MLLLKYLLLAAATGLFAGSAGILFLDVYRGRANVDFAVVRWRAAAKLALLAFVPLLIGLSIVVVPDGMAGVLVSQVSGVLPGTLYPGIHGIAPLVQHVELYDIRDRVFTTAAVDVKAKSEPLKVQTKEGLSVGLGISVRYRLDPRRLDYIHANLPQPVDQELVAPVVASVFRQIVPNYLARDVFSTLREDVRQRASDAIARKLSGDAILVKEVMLRDILLPPEYAKGLEVLLIKVQENDRMAVDLEIKQKQVRTAELEAEAEKARRVKQAEGDAQVVVLQAKAQADAMQHTLPLKEKQIQQTRLEAEARSQAKVIDSKAELEKRKLMSEAEGNHIRVIAAADAERMKSEAAVLKQNPLLIQKIIAERLSDKVQIMMVPNDGKFFFANDVLRGMSAVEAAKSVEREQ
jgi:regulator of protease activity HflC (stomatin/prohibitin superfamily)